MPVVFPLPLSKLSQLRPGYAELQRLDQGHRDARKRIHPIIQRNGVDVRRGLPYLLLRFFAEHGRDPYNWPEVAGDVRQSRLVIGAWQSHHNTGTQQGAKHALEWMHVAASALTEGTPLPPAPDGVTLEGIPAPAAPAAAAPAAAAPAAAAPAAAAPAAAAPAATGKTSEAKNTVTTAQHAAVTPLPKGHPLRGQRMTINLGDQVQEVPVIQLTPKVSLGRTQSGDAVFVLGDEALVIGGIPFLTTWRELFKQSAKTDLTEENAALTSALQDINGILKDGIGPTRVVVGDDRTIQDRLRVVLDYFSAHMRAVDTAEALTNQWWSSDPAQRDQMNSMLHEEGLVAWLMALPAPLSPPLEFDDADQVGQGGEE